MPYFQAGLPDAINIREGLDSQILASLCAIDLDDFTPIGLTIEIAIILLNQYNAVGRCVFTPVPGPEVQ